jgi:hypothetical protein
MIQSLQVSDMHTSPFASASTCRSLASFQYLAPPDSFFDFLPEPAIFQVL